MHAPVTRRTIAGFAPREVDSISNSRHLIIVNRARSSNFAVVCTWHNGDCLPTHASRIHASSFFHIDEIKPPPATLFVHSTVSRCWRRCKASSRLSSSAREPDCVFANAGLSGPFLTCSIRRPSARFICSDFARAQQPPRTLSRLSQ